MEGTLYRLSVVVTGIKKRCRKSERHNLNMGYIPFEELSETRKEELLNNAKGMVATNMKEAYKANLRLDKVVREKIEGFGVSEKWEPFGEENFSLEIKL